MGFPRWIPVMAILVLFLGPETGQAAVSPGLSIVSGNGQAVWEQFRSVPMVFQARDANGNPAANLPITWTISQGQGTLSSPDQKTDGNGLGSTSFVATNLSAGYSFASQTITASTSLGSVNFVITTILSRIPAGGIAPMPQALIVAPPSDNLSLSGKQGTIIPGGFKIQVVALSGVQQGFPVPNIGLRLVDWLNPAGPSPAMCTGQVLTDASGIGTCDVVLTGIPGQYFLAASVGEYVTTQNVQLTITAGAACSFNLSATGANVAAAGASSAVSVTAAQNCSWTASSSVAWITVNSGATGSGNGSVSFTVAPNNGTPRTGVLTIAGLTYTVTQAGAGGGALAITTGATLPAAVSGSAYSIVIATNGGRSPYSFTASGTLPPGLTLAPSTGLLSGTPTAVGTYSFTIAVGDAAGALVSQNFSLNVVQTSPGFNPSITNGSLPNATPGTPYSTLLTSVGGCTSPFSPAPVFSVASGQLPAGLAINALPDRTSVIAGTPTTAGTYTFTMKVTDNCGRSGTATLSLTVGTGGGSGGGGSLVLTASSPQLTFSVQVGNTLTSTQVLNIAATSGAGQFTAQAQMNSASSLNWLSVNPPLSSTPSSVSVTVAAASLPTGVFTGYVVFAPAGGASGSQVVVPVTLRVLPPPAFKIAPPALLYLYQQGTPPSGNQTINIDSASGPFDYAASVATDSGGNWLFVTPLTGTAPGTLNVAVNPLGLATGTYKGTITLRANAAGINPAVIVVTLSIPQVAPLITSVVNAASFLEGPVSPGEFVTLSGTALGPRTPLSGQLNSAGLVDTLLGGTRVLFDGTASPLVYSSPGQINAIVPYTLQGRSMTQVEVEFNGVRSTALPVRVTDTAPGIFAGAKGQAAALNQDGSINSSAAGADPGSIVALYATGEGFTDPAVPDGRIMGDVLAKPLLAVTVTVAGLPANVEYAGSAPGLAAGVMQVNVHLPDDLPRGTAVPVVLSVGRAASQGGVTIYIR